MTSDMIMGLLRQVLPAVGMLLVTLGYVDQGTADSLMNEFLLAVGALLTLAGSAWALQANTKASILQSAADMPEVRSIELKDADLKRKLSSSRKVS